MCSRTAFTKPILPRNGMDTATPPNGVTARCVSRRINRSSDNRAVISRGTGLSVAFDSISLLSQILGPHLTPNFGFPDNRFAGPWRAGGGLASRPPLAGLGGFCVRFRKRPARPPLRDHYHDHDSDDYRRDHWP